MEWIKNEAKLNQLEVFIEYVLEKLSEDIETTNKINTEIRLICEEVLMNVISYAYPNEIGEINVGYEYDKKEKCIVLKICDYGLKFDPTLKEAPDVTMDIMEREIGGLGIYMVMQIADSVTYERQDDMNILTVKKHYD